MATKIFINNFHLSYWDFTGNICRSPIAEALFLDAIKRAGVEDDWIVESAAIADWHVGRPPDDRAWSIMKKYNLEYNYTIRAKQIVENDFKYFDYIFGMDEYNINDLNEIAPCDKTCRIFMLGEFDPQGSQQIRDPYCVRLNHNKLETFISSL